jgi:hypothetical protein
VKSVGVIVRTRDPARIAEALRAAVGLTLRGATVRLSAPALPDDPFARRVRATLREMGHEAEVDEARALAADAVEVWT